MRAGSLFIPVRNLENSAQWYEKHLGVKHIDSWGEGMGFYFPKGPTQLALIQVQETPSTEFQISTRKTNTYFNFLVEDCYQLHEQFKNQEIRVTEIEDFAGMKCFDASDPDGNVLSFVDEPEDSPYHSTVILTQQEAATPE